MVVVALKTVVQRVRSNRWRFNFERARTGGQINFLWKTAMIITTTKTSILIICPFPRGLLLTYPISTPSTAGDNDVDANEWKLINHALVWSLKASKELSKSKKKNRHESQLVEIEKGGWLADAYTAAGNLHSFSCSPSSWFWLSSSSPSSSSASSLSSSSPLSSDQVMMILPLSCTDHWQFEIGKTYSRPGQSEKKSIY